MNAVSSSLQLLSDTISLLPLKDSPPLDPMNLILDNIESLPSFYFPPLKPMKFTLEEHFYFEDIKASSFNDGPLSVAETSSSVEFSSVISIEISSWFFFLMF